MGEPEQDLKEVEWQIDEEDDGVTKYYELSDAISFWGIADNTLQAYRSIYMAATMEFAGAGLFFFVGLDQDKDYLMLFSLLFAYFGILTTMNWIKATKKRVRTVEFCAFLILELEMGKKIKNVKDTYMAFGASKPKSQRKFLKPYDDRRTYKAREFRDPGAMSSKPFRVQPSIDVIPEYLLLIFILFSLIIMATLVSQTSG